MLPPLPDLAEELRRLDQAEGASSAPERTLRRRDFANPAAVSGPLLKPEKITLLPPPPTDSDTGPLGPPPLDAEGGLLVESSFELGGTLEAGVEENDLFSAMVERPPTETAEPPAGPAPVEQEARPPMSVPPAPRLQRSALPVPPEEHPRESRFTVSLDDLGEELKDLEIHAAPAREMPVPIEVVPSRRRSTQDEDDKEIEPGLLDALLRYRVPLREVAAFTRQVATMVAAGIPVHQILIHAAEGDKKSRLCPIVREVARRVSSGSSLSDAMRLFTGVFSPVYVGLIETGESSGHLHQIFQKLADLQEREVALRHRIQATLTYPVILLSVSVVGVMAFIYFVLPLMVDLFASLHLEMPWPTRMLLMSRFAIPVMLVTVLTGAVTGWLMRKSLRGFFNAHPDLEVRLAAIPLRMSTVGPVLEKLIAARVLYAMATMLESGLTLVPTLARVASVSGNAFFANRLERARLQLVAGATVYEALSVHRVFPPAALHLLSAGEEAADLPKMVRYVANYYEEEVGLALEHLVTVLEPAVMLGMGGLVAFVTLSSVLPTVQLLQNL